MIQGKKKMFSSASALLTPPDVLCKIADLNFFNFRSTLMLKCQTQHRVKARRILSKSPEFYSKGILENVNQGLWKIRAAVEV